MTLRAVVEGVGHYLPDRIVPNSEFEKTLDTSDEWIRTRSGIERRHFAADDQTTSDLAVRAARAALADAGLSASDVDGIIVATSTPDLTFPSVATMVQEGLGMTHGFAFDVQAVCAGFVYALANANALITSGTVRRVMVIGGGTIYAAALPLADRLEITRVHAAPAGDTLFPKIDPQEWREVARETPPRGEKDTADVTFLTYRRCAQAPR